MMHDAPRFLVRYACEPYSGNKVWRGLPGTNWLGSLLERLSTTYLACNSLPNELQHNVVCERFCKKSDSSGIECGLAHWRIVSSANEDDLCLGRISAETGLHFQATHVGHPYVQDCYATWGMFEPGEKDGWMVKLLHNKTGRIKQTTERPQHGGVIVEEPDTIAALPSDAPA